MEPSEAPDSRGIFPTPQSPRRFFAENLRSTLYRQPAGIGSAQIRRSIFEQRVFRELEGVPAIASVTAANSLPLERGVNTPMTVVGRPESLGTVEWRAVTPGYLETLGITRIAGRSFEPTDAAGRPPVAIVNDTFARRYFEDSNPIGQRIEIGRSRAGLTSPAIARERDADRS